MMGGFGKTLEELAGPTESPEWFDPKPFRIEKQALFVKFFWRGAGYCRGARSLP
jgi:hypothetical protein